MGEVTEAVERALSRREGPRILFHGFDKVTVETLQKLLRKKAREYEESPMYRGVVALLRNIDYDTLSFDLWFAMKDLLVSRGAIQVEMPYLNSDVIVARGGGSVVVLYRRGMEFKVGSLMELPEEFVGEATIGLVLSYVIEG